MVKLYWKYLKIIFSRTTEPISTKLGTKHPWVKGIQVFIFSPRTIGLISTELCTNHSWVQSFKNLIKWRAVPFSKGRLLQNSENTLMEITKLLQNHWANLNQTWHNASLDKGYSSCSNVGSRPFSRMDNREIAKIHCQNLNIFSRTAWPISTKQSLGEGDSNLFKWWALSFSKGRSLRNSIDDYNSKSSSLESLG